MEKSSEISGVMLDIKSIIVYVSALPFGLSLCVLIFWVVSICVYLHHNYKQLKRLKINATDSFTQKRLNNAKFNFYKFIFVLVLNLIEICAMVFPFINHVAFDNVPFKGENERICYEDCCLVNSTFVYGIEKLEGHGKYASLLIDSATFTSFLTIFWMYGNILNFSQLPFIEKEHVKRKLIIRLRWKTAMNIAISICIWVLMGVPKTLLIGYPAHTILSAWYLYVITTHYLQLRKLRRRHLVDLMYECYDDKARIKQEQHDVKWTERGGQVVIVVMLVILLINGWEMIVNRTLLPILLNPCWLRWQYSIHLNFKLPEQAASDLVLFEHFMGLTRYILILVLLLVFLVVHVTYITERLLTVLRRRRVNDEKIKSLIHEHYVSWNSK